MPHSRLMLRCWKVLKAFFGLGLFMGIADIEKQTATFFNKITEAVKMIPSVYSPDVCVPCAMAELKPRKPVP